MLLNCIFQFDLKKLQSFAEAKVSNTSNHAKVRKLLSNIIVMKKQAINYLEIKNIFIIIPLDVWSVSKIYEGIACF